MSPIHISGTRAASTHLPRQVSETSGTKGLELYALYPTAKNALTFPFLRPPEGTQKRYTISASHKTENDCFAVSGTQLCSRFMAGSSKRKKMAGFRAGALFVRGWVFKHEHFPRP